jgi:cytoskeletal protein CcmA (bactofilin family)
MLAAWRSTLAPRGLFGHTVDPNVGQLASRAPATDDIAGGNAVIFRKDSRGDSFQRQISSLRKQTQEDEPAAGEFHFDEPTDTSQFTTSSAPSRDETFAPSRLAAEESAHSQVMGQTQVSFRPGWQSSDPNTSVIAANAHWNGTLRSDGSLHVHGRADGELHAANDVFVAEGAEVDAQLFADNVVVAGVVRGKIEARGRLEILAQGHVSGDVKAPKLVVHEGARLSGQLKMETGGGATTMSGDPTAAKPRRSSQ